MIVLLLSSSRRIRKGDFGERLYIMMAYDVLFLCGLEMCTFLIIGKTFPGARILALITNSLLFIGGILFTFIWALFADFKIFESEARLKKIYTWAGIPAYIGILLAILNWFTPVYFSISAENIYYRTKWVTVPFIIDCIYGFYGAGLILFYQRRVKKYMFMPVVLFLFPIVTGFIFQATIYGLSVIWPSAAISIVSLYINFQNENSLIDSLSGLYTRQYLDNYLKERIKNMPKENLLAGVMMDFDRFKQINDTYGHQAGDSVIRDVGAILHMSTDYHDFAARYGGDEFVVIREIQNEEEAKNLLAEIENKVLDFNRLNCRPYKIAFSYGTAIYHPSTVSADDFLKEMDQAMYMEKQTKSCLLPDRRHRTAPAEKTP